MIAGAAEFASRVPKYVALAIDPAAADIEALLKSSREQALKAKVQSQHIKNAASHMSELVACSELKRDNPNSDTWKSCVYMTEDYAASEHFTLPSTSYVSPSEAFYRAD